MVEIGPRIFISFRFAEAEIEGRTLKAALQEQGVSTFLCDVPEGDDIAAIIAKALDQCKLVVILGTETYGMDTGAGFSTFEELRFIKDEKKSVFLVKMCERFAAPETRLRISNSISRFNWEKGLDLPSTLVPRIIEKLSLIEGQSSTDLVDCSEPRKLVIRKCPVSHYDSARATAVPPSLGSPSPLGFRQPPPRASLVPGSPMLVRAGRSQSDPSPLSALPSHLPRESAVLHFSVRITSETTAQCMSRSLDRTDQANTFSSFAASGHIDSPSIMRSKKRWSISERREIRYPDGSSYWGEVADCSGFGKLRPHGIGIYYYHNGDRYEGEFGDGKQHGTGIYYYANGDLYQGAWENNKKQGRGRYRLLEDDGKVNLYDGDWASDKQHGRGTYYFSSGDRYEGEWKNGFKHGKGICYYLADGPCKGDRYEGDYANDMQEGNGTYYFNAKGPSQGSRYEGSFICNRPEGSGVIYQQVASSACGGSHGLQVKG
jgi:hypothetical protein